MKHTIHSFLFATAICMTMNAQKAKELDALFTSYLSTDPNAPVTAILVNLENAKSGFSYKKGFGRHSLESSEKVHKNSPFKIASITKILTATVILQLAESGGLTLEDKASDLLKGTSYIKFDDLHKFNGRSYGIELTVKQLLTHTSGLADIFTDAESEFIELFAIDPTKQWTPKSLFDTYYNLGLNSKAHFKPGDGFYYSDTNYFLLGLIIEQITGLSLAENYRTRVLRPAQMKNTYFEYHEASRNKENMPSTYLQSMEINKDINTSFDWAGGGIVSTTEDMSLFMRALFNHRLIKDMGLFKQMIADTGTGYGMGISMYSINNQIFYGHGGYWGSLVCFNPDTQESLVISINQSDPPFRFNELLRQTLVLMR
jgi:D-alanyl-D-alanine carboxypeptidase